MPSIGQPLEIACDESGYEGERLIGTTTDVFAHASVRMDTRSAMDCMQELRVRIRSPATEYKASHLLRERHRSVLTWLLGPLGPLRENAHGYLIDKAFHVVRAIVDLFLGHAFPEPSGSDQRYRPREVALALYREGPDAFGREGWEAFLMSSNNLLRAKGRPDAKTSVDSFLRLIDVLRPAGSQGLDEPLGLLWQATPHGDSLCARLLHNPATIPALDPLIPAIVQAVVYWGDSGVPVSIVHDRQSTLSEARIAQLTDILGKPHPRGRLTSLKLVDSGADARIQVADILAGAARKISSDELNGRGDPELTALLRPYVDPFSIWGDERSWSVLRPA